MKGQQFNLALDRLSFLIAIVLGSPSFGATLGLRRVESHRRKGIPSFAASREFVCSEASR